MSSKPIQAHVSEQRDAPRARPAPAPWRDWLGVVPFFLFAFLFIVLPSVYLLIGAFRNSAGAFTLKNFADLFTPAILDAYWVTIRISAVTALAGGLLGFMMAYAVTVGGLPNGVRTILSTFSGVAANFAGVPLAFAFIATLGRTGMVTVFLKTVLGLDLYDQGFSLYSFWGLSLTYLYFQFPLMVLVITPALDGLKREWREAAENLGASTFQYWGRVALPILLPSILGSMILLFGNSFGAYATALSLTGGFINLVTIVIGSQIKGDILYNPGLGYALAVGMVIVMALAMLIYFFLRRRSERWLRQ
ncbi:MAG TPA: ABC transporter permease subunit [Anaerolineae bacterium]|nr:ABC transporter permease subunit [Anaerolineae bacterium]HUM36732.1 ABC transporter permease subunit [Anaerolineae bacterium]